MLLFFIDMVSLSPPARVVYVSGLDESVQSGFVLEDCVTCHVVEFCSPLGVRVLHPPSKAIRVEVIMRRILIAGCMCSFNILLVRRVLVRVPVRVLSLIKCSRIQYVDRYAGNINP